VRRLMNSARRLTEDRTLLKDTIWGLTLEATMVIGTLVSFSLLGRQLGAQGYGQYASLYAIAAPLGTLAVAGVTLTQLQYILRAGEDLERTSRSCLSMTLGVGVILTVIGTLIASHIVAGLAVYAIVLILVLEFISYPSVVLASTAVLARDGFAAGAKLRLIPIVLRIFIILGLYASGHLSIATLGGSYLAVTAILALAMLWKVSRVYGISLRPGAIDGRHFKTSLTYSAGVSGMSVQNDGDKAVLAAYRYEVDTGLYSAAYRVVQFGLVPVQSFTNVTHQRFLSHEPGRRNQHLLRSLRFGGVVAVYGLAFWALAVASAPVLPWLLGEEFEGSVIMMQVLGPLVLLRGLATFPLNGLLGLERTFVRSALLVVSAIVSLALFIALVPIMQWRGAAIGTLVGEAWLAASAWAALVYYQRLHDRERLPAELLELEARGDRADDADVRIAAPGA
jgi:O-antigen/teichoic acid export membrane protein